MGKHQAYQQILAQILDLIRRIEKVENDGAPCILTRCNLLASIGHHLGVQVEDLQVLEWMLDEYNLDCSCLESQVFNPERN